MSTHGATVSTHSLSAALQRIEKTAPLQNPQNFTFSTEMSLEMLESLERAVKIKDKANLVVNIKVCFKSAKLIELYPPIVEKFLNINPPLAPFTRLMNSSELHSMLQFVSWLVIFDIIDPDLYPEGLDDVRRTIYDRLSIDFSQLQMKLTSSTVSLSDRFIELWSSVVCASIFTLILTIYQDSELYRNICFALRIENDVRLLLVGFASPNVKDYHRSILSLMPNDLKIAVSTVVTVGGEDYSIENLTTALTYEPQIAAAWQQRNTTLFQASTTTGLMQNAMKLKGAKMSQPKHSRTVKKGNVEKSGLPIAKARVVLKNTDKIIANYHVDKNKVVVDICATEETYTEVPIVAPITQLGVTFENFGTKPKYPPVASSVRSPRPMMKRTAQSARSSKRQSSRRERPPGTPRFKYRKVPDIPEIISTIQSAHEDLTANPIFIL